MNQGDQGSHIPVDGDDSPRSVGSHQDLISSKDQDNATFSDLMDKQQDNKVPVSKDQGTQGEKEQTQSPSSTNLRWLALILASFLVFGNDYCFDLPQALQTPIQQRFQISEMQFNLLYSVYSIPNILLPFFAGYLLDSIGIKAGILIFNFLIILGHSMFTMGTYDKTYWMLIAGRALFGVGAESLNVTQSTVVHMWFKNKELSTALGISLCICRLGSSLNSYLSPKLFEHYDSLYKVSAFGYTWLLISLACGLYLIRLDSKYIQPDANIKKQIGAEHKAKLSDVKYMGPSFWLLYINAILCFLSFFSWLNIGNRYLSIRYDFEATQAGTLLILPYGVATILTPLISYFIDKKGYKGSLMIFACAVLASVHFYLAYTQDCYQCNIAMPALILYGLFFAMHTGLLIASVAAVVPHKIAATAFGIIYSGQNLGLAVGPLIVGSILQNEQSDMQHMSKVLGSLSVVALILAVANFIYDKFANNGVLELSMEEEGKRRPDG